MKFVLILGMLMVSSIAIANERGNGGDSVVCNGNLYTLDSVLMSQHNHYEIISASTYKESLQKITDRLMRTLPDMGEKLKEFVGNYHSKGNPREGVFWLAGTLKEVQDENTFIEIPKNCSQNPIQTVVRVSGSILRYYYDPKIIEALADNQDQLSWLLIHEWLRDFVEDSDQIRFLNSYLHSEEFFKSDEIEVNNSLKSLGIGSPGLIATKHHKIVGIIDSISSIMPELQKETNRLILELKKSNDMFKSEIEHESYKKNIKELWRTEYFLADALFVLNNLDTSSKKLKPEINRVVKEIEKLKIFIETSRF